MMDILITAVVVGAVVAAAFFVYSRYFARRLEKDILGRIQDSFASASLEALKQNSEQFFGLAKERLSKESELGAQALEGKKELIDSTLNQIKAEMNKVEELMAGLEKDREGKFAALSSGLQAQNEETIRLKDIIINLNKVLSSSQSRGQWGERMAEDILRLAGLTEQVSYIKQTAVGNNRNRPDYTFLLPQGKVVNMDVKFPFDNYRRYCEEKNEVQRESHKKQFLRDARLRIKEVTSRDYINTDGDTLDYVLVFIPLEQAYVFIMENDPAFIDDALKLKVVVCSPWTLYAYVAVIRQSIDNFNLEKSAGQILNQLQLFYKQWKVFKDIQTKLGKHIDTLQSDYNTMITTRTNQLEKPLEQIEQLRRQKGIDDNESD